MKQFVICMILALLVVCTCYCYSAESKQNNKKQKTTNTSKEIRQKKQLFNQCIASGISRSRCLYLYY